MSVSGLVIKAMDSHLGETYMTCWWCQKELLAKINPVLEKKSHHTSENVQSRE